MKTATFLTCIFCLLFFHIQSFSQFNGAYTYYYNSSSNIAYSSEVAEAAAADLSDNIYVAGEKAKETTSQDLHIIKYKNDGSVIASTDYVNATYKEYVKKVLVNGSNVYVICNAVNISTNKPSLLILRYNANLSLQNAPVLALYNSPTDACLDDSGNVFISCYKSTDTTSELETLKLSSTLLTVRTYEYHYQNTYDHYKENPLSMYYISADKAVYVAGNVISPTNTSATLLIKLSAATDARSWINTSSFIPGKNSFNSVRATSQRVYGAGSQSNKNNTYLLVQSFNYRGQLLSTYTYYDIISAKKLKSTEALKITYADTFQINVTGISKDSASQKCDIVLSFLNPTLDSTKPLSVTKVAMPYNTTVTDAATQGGSGYSLITGCKAVGSNQNMFLYGYTGSVHGSNVDYRDSIVNRSACGNSIVYFSAFQAWVTGYLDIGNVFSPTNYEYFTRRYFDSGIILKSVPVATNNFLKTGISNNPTTVSPNPANDYINIAAKESIKNIQLFNETGIRVLQQHVPTPNTFSYTLHIQSLPSGVYVLKINNSESFKLIKE